LKEENSNLHAEWVLAGRMETGSKDRYFQDVEDDELGSMEFIATLTKEEQTSMLHYLAVFALEWDGAKRHSYATRNGTFCSHCQWYHRKVTHIM
jgi:hypothetical protein